MKTKKYAVPEGCKITSVDLKNGVIIYECNEPEEPKFKRGDFVATKYIGGSKYIVIVDHIDNSGLIYFYAYLSDTGSFEIKNDFGLGRVVEDKEFTKHATPEEKQLLLDKMHEQGKDWDGEKIVDCVWKPKVGEPYWVVNANMVNIAIWRDDAFDDQRFKDSRVFATEALANAAFSELQRTLKQAKKY